MNRALILLCLIATFVPVLSQAQAPRKDVYANPGNLKVLPKDTDSKTLSDTMKGFAVGLGVRCETCHVGEAGQPLDTFDFESDDKEMKRKARIMMKMVRDINRKQVPKLDRVEKASRVEVRCVTCHRGLQKPMLIQDVLDDELAGNGIDATLEKYAALREKYYGSHSYDFSEFTLPMYAQGLAKPGNMDAAIALAKVNTENLPESYYSHFVLAELYRAAKQKEPAIEYYQKAIKLEPKAAAFLQSRIDALNSE